MFFCVPVHMNIFHLIWAELRKYIDVIMSIFGFSSPPIEDNGLQVFIKTNIGEKIVVNLNPQLTVGDLKCHVAEKLKSSASNLRIIFAGKELPNNLFINECDIGNRSILHAVRLENISSQSSSTIKNDTIKKEKPVSSANSKKSSFPTINETTGSSKIKDVSKFPTLLCDSSTVLNIQLSQNEIQELQKLKASEQEKPHFYVYCTSPCASIQIGKLRVRCSECKSGALTLHKDPSNWNDVLRDNKITGTCENPECEGSYAEFYFKCSHHETTGEDDTAVVLYLLRTNLPGVSCLACTDVSSPIVVFDCSSAHAMCLDCFVIYCISRLNERQFVHSPSLGYTLPCPVGCEDSLIREVHHFHLMGEHQYERYQRFGAEEAVLAVGGVLCPQPGCGQGLIVDPDCRRIKCDCGFVFCRDCLQGFHIGLCIPAEGLDPTANASAFAVDSNRAVLSSWDEASSVTIRVISKPCPKCRTPTERDGGCMHMVCTRASCQFNWCWVCQTEWSRECMSAHWFG